MMNKQIPTWWPILLLIVLFCNACKKKEWDEFYGRPEWLADPMYQQLASRGNFTSFLKLVDKAGYKDVLSKAGYWTLFAPNDQAFAKFLENHDLQNVEQMSDSMAVAIVKYALVYNAYRKDQLSSAQASGGSFPNTAYKRKTAYYDFVKVGPGEGINKIIDANANGSFVSGDNNNKYIPYFLSGYMNAQGLQASDYTYFYPESEYTGFNVVNAQVITADIQAENGIIHEIDRVIWPLSSIDRYLASKPQYSYFKSLLDQFLVSYQANAEITERYHAVSGSADSVYTKLYDAALAFSPNNENHVDNRTAAQSESWTLMVPENDALKTYIEGPDGILAKFGTFEKAPLSVLIDLINAHMWGTAVWPSKFKTTYNAQNEVVTFDLSNVTDHQILSNGMFYGLNKVQDANVFRTVYSKVYLDPAYLLMNRAMEGAGIKFSLINPLLKYTVLLMSDEEVRQDGYSYNTTINAWTYTVNGVTQSGTVPQNNFYRKLQLSIIPEALTDFTGEGILQTLNEEFIKYRNGQFYAAGNEDQGTAVTVESIKNTVNGPVYYTKGILAFSENQIGFHLEKLAQQDPDNFGHFFNYLKNSTARYDAVTQQINGTVVGAAYTIFVPTNAAIEQAVRDGLLPGDVQTGIPNFTPSEPGDIDQVSNFIYYHILDKKTIAADKKTDDALAYNTLYKDAEGNPTYLYITKQLQDLQIRDAQGNITHTLLAKSNNLSNRALIHVVNRVLHY